MRSMRTPALVTTVKVRTHRNRFRKNTLLAKRMYVTEKKRKRTMCPISNKDLRPRATSKNTLVKLPSLPPTADATFEHLKRVFFYKFKHGSEEKYHQKNGIGKMWSILWCRKSGLNCTAACLECNGDSCTNSSPTIYINEIDDDDNKEQ
ncbi:hypothetical protein TNCV_1143381 [Trichonephila clavipes]|nr:hypothetical protein TNCV_1143381 [Trichonephila clavipes]